MAGRHIYADADGPGRRTRERRRSEDLKFLTKIRTANLETLLTMLRNHSTKNAPPWKIVALRRAIAREQQREREASK